jgi:hypothetical protein
MLGVSWATKECAPFCPRSGGNSRIRSRLDSPGREEILRWNNGLRDQRVSQLDLELQACLEDYIEECR